MNAKKTVEDLKVAGKRVLVRCDFNVPIKNGVITDETRINAALPTIKYLIGQGAKVILCSHMGKPKGEPMPEYSLAPVAESLAKKLPCNVIAAFDDTVVGPNARKAVAEMKDGEVVLLQNTRFRAEETKNVENFSKELAELADLFVNDAFGAAHRAHCSTVGVASFVSESANGYLMAKEVKFLGDAVNNPVRPFVCILGGAKVADKLNVIKNLLTKADTLIIGGGMAYTFLKAQGYCIGTSLVDDEKLDYCKEMLALAKKNGVKLLLPVDTVIASEFPNPIDGAISVSVVDSDKIPADKMGLDIGPKSRELFASAIREAKTVVWNGPMGVFENPTLAEGTIAVAKAMAETDATTVIGGGDSAAAVNSLGFGDKMSHISTGGGASLEYLEGIDLPGIAAMTDKPVRKTVIAGNWKMNKTPAEAVELIEAIKAANPNGTPDNEIAICCVPYVDIDAAVKAASGSFLHIGAENCHWEKSGAFTGEISADMLVACGVEYVIIGHSERRQYFGETDLTVNKRVKAALEAGLKVILCVGELLEQREQGITEEIISMQVKIDLADITAEQMANIIIAYEPVWAIGTGKTATADQADEVCGAIRATVAKLYDANVAEALTVQYGGSMNAKNCAELLAKPNVDGGLIGGAALKAPDFTTIIEAGK